MMARLGLLLFVLLIALRVLFRRLVRGRKHPTWSMRFELVAEVVRALVARNPPESEGAQGSDDPLRTMVSPIPRKLRSVVRLETRELSGRYTEVLTPAQWSEGGPQLFYLHGGGYVTCSPRSHRGLLARIAQASGARVIAPDYRKAPEHPFPAALDDARAAYAVLLEEGVDPETLGLGGDSAGGGLSLALLQRLRAEGAPLPSAVVLLSPWVDFCSDTASLRDNAPFDYLREDMLPLAAAQYAGGRELADPLLSPLHADLAGLPATLIESGGAEIFLGQNEALAARMAEVGVEVVHEVEPGMIHVFPAFSDVEPRGRAAIERIGRFLSSRLTTGS